MIDISASSIGLAVELAFLKRKYYGKDKCDEKEQVWTVVNGGNDDDVVVYFMGEFDG